MREIPDSSFELAPAQQALRDLGRSSPIDQQPIWGRRMMNRRNLLLQRSPSHAHDGRTRAAPPTSPSCPASTSTWSHRPSCIRTSRPPRQARRSSSSRSTIEEKEVVIDDEGTKFQAMTFNGSMPGPLMVVHEGDYVEVTLVNPGDQHDAAQHRLPFRDRRARRRRADPDQPGRAGRAALEGHAHRHVRLSLRAGRPDDPVARRVRHAAAP